MAARDATGLGQRALAQRLEVGQSVISKCESGERQLNIVELRTWCQQGLGISWLEFLQQYEVALAELDAPLHATTPGVKPRRK